MTPDLDPYCDGFVRVLLGTPIVPGVWLVDPEDAYETPSWPDHVAAAASLRAVIDALEALS